MTTLTSSCAPVNLPCTTSKTYINPCNCREYFQCTTDGYNFLVRNCASGTAWNDVTGFCDEENKIFIADGTPICEKNAPWSRCSKIPNNYSKSQLKNSCQAGTGPTDPLGTTPPGRQNESGGDDGGGSAAAIVGGVVGGLLAIVVVAFFVFWWKKRKPGRSKKTNVGFRPSIHRVDEHEKEEEVYDVIEEKSAAERFGSSVVMVDNAAYGTEPYDTQEPTQYDNPTFSGKSDEENNNYTNLSVKYNPQPQSARSSAEVSTRKSSTSSRRQHLHSDLSDRESDLSRSISVGGQDILVEDPHGYQIGYPSGTIPRQPPSPLPPPPDDFGHDDDDDDDDDDGYQLGQQMPLPSDYMGLEKTDL